MTVNFLCTTDCMCYVEPKRRPFCCFVRIFTGFSIPLTVIKGVLECKYIDFQRDPLSVKADGLARISNVNILVMDNLINTCVFKA